MKRLRGLWGAELAARVGWALARVHLGADLASRLPHRLSGGQLQRVAMARALAVSPSLPLLDEPTSALDVSLQAAILQLLDELRRDLGLALVFVSHDLNVVRPLCRRALVMHAGRVVEQGPTQALFDTPAHPYTARLCAAIPRLGEPPAPAPALAAAEASPSACALAPSCPLASPRCRRERPLPVSLGDGRKVACFHRAPAPAACK